VHDATLVDFDFSRQNVVIGRARQLRGWREVFNPEPNATVTLSPLSPSNFCRLLAQRGVPRAAPTKSIGPSLRRCWCKNSAEIEIRDRAVSQPRGISGSVQSNRDRAEVIALRITSAKREGRQSSGAVNAGGGSNKKVGINPMHCNRT
jgi:hypothetical protein